MQRTNNRKNRPMMALGVAAGIAPLAAAGAQGAVVYGSFNGTTTDYLNVTETPTQLPGPTPAELFGPPVVSGDTLEFLNPGFSVAVNGGALEFQDSHLTTNIVPAGSSSLKTITITEGGGWGVGGGTNATSVLESLVVNQLFITSLNGIAINPIVVTPNISFTDTNNGSATVVTNSNSIKFESNGGFSTGSWNGIASFNLAATLAADNVTGNVTGLSLGLDNQLAGSSETNSDAFIDKKYFDITATTTSVPEPTTAGIAALAVAGMAVRRRTRVAGSALKTVGSAVAASATGGMNTRRSRRAQAV